MEEKYIKEENYINEKRDASKKQITSRRRELKAHKHEGIDGYRPKEAFVHV